jgi:hypothetical protein
MVIIERYSARVQYMHDEPESLRCYLITKVRFGMRRSVADHPVTGDIVWTAAASSIDMDQAFVARRDRRGVLANGLRRSSDRSVGEVCFSALNGFVRVSDRSSPTS